MDPSTSELRIDDLELIDRICDEFTRELRLDACTPITGFAERVPERLRTPLLRELVGRHVEFRREQGETPRPEDYADLPGESVLHLADVGVFDAGDSLSRYGSTADQRTPEEESRRPANERHAKDDVIGRYRLVNLLGRGAFGEVWRARDTKFEQDVAIKLLRGDCRSHEMTARFEDEARRQAALRNVPGIVPVYDVGEDRGIVYLVSAFVPGGTLQRRLPKLAREERLGIVAEVARILHRAHRRGVVHRDVKPANILLDDDDRPLLTDFGIAATERELLTEPDNVIIGTYAYMSPEQIDARANLADPRTDVYSLGVVLYECLVGERPYGASEQDRETLKEAVLAREPWPPRSRDETISREIERICLKCLAKDPRDRYSSAGDVARALSEGRRWNRRAWLLGTGVALAVGSWSVVRWSWAPDGDTDRSGNTVGGDSGSADRTAPVALRHCVFGQDLATWRIMADGATLLVHAPEHVLFEFADPPHEDDYDFSVVLHHEDGNGVVGVAFGIRPGVAGSEAIEFRGLELSAGASPSVVGFVRKYDPTGLTGPWDGPRFGRTHFDPTPSGRVRVSISVRNGFVDEIRLGEQTLPRLVDDFRRHGPVGGSIGLWCTSAGARFSELVLDGTPVRIRSVETE